MGYGEILWKKMFFIILLGVCVSYDTQFDIMHDTEKSKIDLQYDSQFDNYAFK